MSGLRAPLFKHDRQASRLIVISPIIGPKAHKIAERLVIDCFADSIDVEDR